MVKWSYCRIKCGFDMKYKFSLDKGHFITGLTMVKKNLNFQNLIKYEYFPAELPKCFNTRQMAENAEKILQLLKNSGQNANWSSPYLYPGYKNIYSRRQFAIPNFFHYALSAKCISDHSKEILAVTSKDDSSLTAPLDKAPLDGFPYYKKSNKIKDTKFEIEKLYLNNRYCIRLDITAFFSSIYTHAIAWAIHGKNKSKDSKHDKALLGNNLDKVVRNMNSAETNGILTGNAISRIVSEIILSAVDETINKRLSELKINADFLRYVDDYYIFTKDYTSIETIIEIFRRKLDDYHLSLNESKVKIEESPFIFDNEWLIEIENVSLNSDLLLNKAIILYKKYKNIKIFKYALKKMRYCKKENLKVLGSKLLNLWSKFPSLSEQILIILAQIDVKDSYLKSTIYSLIDDCIRLNLQEELVWVVFAIKEFHVKISSHYQCKILESKNDLAIIIILDILESNQLKRTKQTTNELNGLKKYLTTLNDEKKVNNIENNEGDELVNDNNQKKEKKNNISNRALWQKHWLLIYECVSYNWLNLKDKINCLITKENERFFFELNERNLHFYDSEYKLLSEITKKETKNESSQENNDEQKKDDVDTDDLKNKGDFFFYFFDY